MIKFLAPLLLLLPVSVIVAQPGPGPAPGFPPSFKIVSSVDQKKGQVFILDTAYKMIPVVVERAVVVNGKEERVLETRNQMVAEQRTIVIDMANSRVITPDQKQLPIDEVWKRLKANSVVVMSGDGQTPSPVYLRALNAEALILIPTMAAPKAPDVPRPVPQIVPPERIKN